jgi:hypothetical protein
VLTSALQNGGGGLATKIYLSQGIGSLVKIGLVYYLGNEEIYQVIERISFVQNQSNLLNEQEKQQEYV